MKLKKILQIGKLYLNKNNLKGIEKINPVILHAQIKVSENCNARCVTCDVWKNNSPDNNMLFEDYKNNLLQLKKTGLMGVSLTGGEPLLNPDIIQICKFTKENKIRVNLGTNGLLLEKKYKELINYVNQINVSIDGLEKTNDYIRGVKGYFKKATNALIKIRKEYPKKTLKIATTIISQNIDEIPELLKFCKQHKIIWAFNLLDTSPYFFKKVDLEPLLIKDEKKINEFKKCLLEYKKKEVIQYSNSTINLAVAYLKNKETKLLPCFLGFITAYLDAKSNLYSGCWVFPPLGNLKEENIGKILSSGEYKKRIIGMYQRRCPNCTCGFNTNVDIYNLDKYVGEKIFNIPKL